MIILHYELRRAVRHLPNNRQALEVDEVLRGDFKSWLADLISVDTHRDSELLPSRKLALLTDPNNVDDKVQNLHGVTSLGLFTLILNLANERRARKDKSRCVAMMTAILAATCKADFFGIGLGRLLHAFC